MIKKIHPSRSSLNPGQSVSLDIVAAYPLRIEVYGFLTLPLPTGAHCVLSPTDPSLPLEQTSLPFTFTACDRLFTHRGFLEFRVVDAEGAFQTCEVEVIPKRGQTMNNRLWAGQFRK